MFLSLANYAFFCQSVFCEDTQAGSAIHPLLGRRACESLHDFPFAVYTLAVCWFQVGVVGILYMLEISFAVLYSFLFSGENLPLSNISRQWR
jgi:hypothetical protein